MTWNRLSMRGKLFVAISATALLVILIMVVMVTWSMRSGFTHYLLNAELETTTPLVEALGEDYDAEYGGWPEISPTGGSWVHYTKGVILAHRIKEGLPPRPPERPLAGGGTFEPPSRDPLKVGPRLFLLNSDRELIAGGDDPRDGAQFESIVAQKGPKKGKVVGYLGIRPPIKRNEVADRIYLTGQIESLTYASLFALLISAGVASILAKQLSSPIKKLAESTQSLADGDYSIRLSTSRNDELGQLIEDFNVLGESLEKKEKAERQWISDTSHELKTPLAILRAEIEALQDGVRKASTGAFSTLHSAVMRISDLTEALSMLSYAREGKLVRLLKHQNLTTLTAEAINASRSYLEDAELNLTTQLETDLIIDADPKRLHQLFGNLLENSRRYTNAPGMVNVSLSRSDEKAVLIVEDSNPAPSADAMQHLFDRFYRVEGSRSRASGGAGLGLSICKAIIDGHGGEITCDGSDLGGLRITVTLPLVNGTAKHAL
ncbi:ATP-binding protein [Pseudovibrio sp. SCP19]|uniref:ATP-binding protein n=1 Tax=Pseudovibrio sp. SCP19 TaxID=3141374 RepID=UPI003338F2C0